MESNLSFGRVTIPTDVDVVPETKEILKRWAQTPYVIVTGRIFLKNCAV